MALSKTPQEVIQGSPIDPNKQPSPAEMTTLLTEMREEYIGLEEAVAYASLLRQSWVGLTSLAPSGIGQRAEVSDNDTGSHTDPQTGLTVPNAGQYTAFGTAAGDWTWVQETGLGGKLSAAQNLADVADPAEALDNLSGASIGALEAVQVAVAARATTVYVDEGLAGKAPLSHSHAISGVTGLEAALDGKAAVSHEHAISGVTGLEAALDGKAASSHTHGISAVTGLQTALDAKSTTAALLITDARTIHAPDRPGDNPEAFSTTLTGAGADKAALASSGVSSVSGSGLCYALTGAGSIAMRNPIAIGRDVWQVSARFRRTLNPADPNNHAISLRVAWLDAAKSQISVQTLANKADALTSSGTMTLSARVSALDVEGVIAPPTGAVYACPYLQTYGEDGATAVETLRAAEITDLALADIGDLSDVVAAAEAATAAANAASLVNTATLATMADVATYSRPSDVGVVSIKSGYAPGDGFGGQWYYDESDTTSASAPPAVLVGSDGARYKPTAKLPTRFNTVAAMQAFTGYLPPGWDVEAEGHPYKVAPVGADNYHRLTAGGVKLYVMPEANGIDVTACGAVGDWDGVTGTDNTYAILLAAQICCEYSYNVLTSAQSQGPVLFFPGGAFLVSGTITITKPITIAGLGPRSSQIHSTYDGPVFDYDINSGGGETYVTEHQAPPIRDLKITGDRTLPNQHAVAMTKGEDRRWIHLDNVHVRGVGGNAVWADQTISFRMHRCLLMGNGLAGLKLTSDDFMTDSRITECIIRRNKVGIHFDGVDIYTVWVTGCLIEQNDAGEGVPGSDTRPCVGILNEGGIQTFWLQDNYFEGHLNDLRQKSGFFQQFIAENNLFDVTSKTATICSYGKPVFPFRWFMNEGGNVDAVQVVGNRGPNYLEKPASVTDADWGTYDVVTTITGSGASGSTTLAVSDIAALYPGAMISIDGLAGYYEVTDAPWAPTGSSFAVTLSAALAGAVASGTTVTIYRGASYPGWHLSGSSVYAERNAEKGSSGKYEAPIYMPRNSSFTNFKDAFTNPATGFTEHREHHARDAVIQTYNTYSLHAARVHLRARQEMHLNSKNTTSAFSGELCTVIGSDGCTVSTGTSGAALAAKDSDVTGNMALAAAADDSSVSASLAAVIAAGYSHANSGGRNAVIGAWSSESDHAQTVVLASQGVKTAGTFRVTGGYGGDFDDGVGVTSARTWEIVSTTGDINVAGSLTPGVTFSDFAEYFENLVLGVIPLGTIVALEGDRVRPAVAEDRILGVVSGTAAVAAGDSALAWAGKYLTGDFGEPIYEDVPDMTWEPRPTTTEADRPMIPDPSWIPGPDEGDEDRPMIPLADWAPREGETEADRPMIRVKKVNPEFDPARENVPRSERPDEWSCVGLIGQVFTRVAADVAPGDYVAADGSRSDAATGLVCMSIKKAFDAGSGFAIAKCLIGAK